MHTVLPELQALGMTEEAFEALQEGLSHSLMTEDEYHNRIEKRLVMMLNFCKEHQSAPGFKEALDWVTLAQTTALADPTLWWPWNKEHK
jgi:hypothetical protein